VNIFAQLCSLLLLESLLERRGLVRRYLADSSIRATNPPVMLTMSPSTLPDPADEASHRDDKIA